MSFTVGFLLGVISGIIANLIYRYIVYNKKPEIEICKNKILTYNSKDIPSLKIKIINKSSHEIVDIQIKLYGIKHRDTSNNLKSLYPLSNYYIDYIPAINSQNCDYSHRAYLVSLNHNNIHEEIKKFKKLMLFIKATDVYNSTIAINTDTFESSELLEHGWDFDKCKSCDVTKNTHTSTPSKTKINANLKKQKINNCPFL